MEANIVDPNTNIGIMENLRTNSENRYTPYSKCSEMSFPGVAARLSLFYFDPLRICQTE